MSLDKWRKYYRYGSIPPWDSRLPSSQLIRFMSECPQQLISMSRTDMILCQDVASQHKTSGRLHTCPKCEDLWSMRHEDGHGTFNCLEFACGTGASCVYMAQTLGKRARVIGVTVRHIHAAAAIHNIDSFGLIRNAAVVLCTYRMMQLCMIDVTCLVRSYGASRECGILPAKSHHLFSCVD